MLTTSGASVVILAGVYTLTRLAGASLQSTPNVYVYM
jgi:hypothetical protein